MTSLAENDRHAVLRFREPASSGSTTFASLRVRNFRLFASGQLFSNTGSWVQRIAQDWLVLTLTGSTTVVGLTTALQFLPTMLFGMLGGLLADRMPKRKILLWTQVGMAAMAAVLATLTLSGAVRAWQVELVALGLGVVTAIDNPTRQAFVHDMVGPDRLANAVSINSSVFQLGGLVGPAASGLLIGAVGPGWSFALNAVSYVAPFVALTRMRDDELAPAARAPAAHGELRAALRYVTAHSEILWTVALVGVFGLFTPNLAVTLSGYARTTFHTGASGYGLLSALAAIGSVAGALVAARRPPARLRTLLTCGSALCVAYAIAACAPNIVAFAALLPPIGACTLLLLTAALAVVQLAAEDAIRGRVIGVYLLVFVGAAAVGGPLVGAIDQQWSPSAGLALGSAVMGLALVVIGVAAGELPAVRRRRVAG